MSSLKLKLATTLLCCCAAFTARAQQSGNEFFRHIEVRGMMLVGPKAAFGPSLNGQFSPPPEGGPGLRQYNDGYVNMPAGTAGFTRDWGYNNPSQFIPPDEMVFHSLQPAAGTATENSKLRP